MSNNIDPKWIDPVTGRLRSYASVHESEIRTKEAARRATILADAETEARKGETQKRLDLARRVLAEKKHNDAPARDQRMWKDHVANLEQTLASEAAQAAKDKAFASNELVRLTREGGDLLEKSGHLYFRVSDRTEIDTLVAISRSTAYPTPEAMLADYNQLYDKLHSENLAAEQAREREHEEQMLRSGLAHAESQVRIAELQQGKARQPGGTDAQ
jgi:hypothetical protein